MIWEGDRPGNSDGDNFKLNAARIDDDGSPVFLLFPSATIDKNFEIVGGTKLPLNYTSTETRDWLINIKDTAAGANNDTVYIDYLAFCSE